VGSHETIRGIRYLAGTEGGFRKLLNSARLDSLSNRDSRIFAFRYGLTGGKVHSLAETGRHFSISREWSRRIIQKAHQTIVSRALSQLNSELLDQPCAKLALYTRQFVYQEPNKAGQHLATLITQEFQGLAPTRDFPKFIASVAHPDMEPAKEDINTALRLSPRQYSRHMQPNLAQNKFEKLLSYTAWPAKPKKINDKDMLSIRQAEKKSLTTGSASFHSHKMGRLVQYTSDLELRFLRLIEQVD
jgi:hypothetical protein